MESQAKPSVNMSPMPSITRARRPPTFDEARTKRQKARAAGLDPNYWYAVELDEAVKPGQVVEVIFWKQSIALYRGLDGKLRALENRCAHRQLKLSIGNVEGCRLICAYHGWQYDEQGKVVDFSHDLFDKPTPNFRIRTFPVQARYGLIWIFPGDPELAVKKKMPEIPEVEGKDRWAIALTDYMWEAHHSMIVDNVSDFTHANLSPTPSSPITNLPETASL
jgi:phenylpropionate dioxygenase-like ring-hydroxylating dioxygenase large terminal subunit